MIQRLRKMFYSFPVQLLVLHLRSNLFLLAIWIFLLLLISDSIGKKLGIKYLFLSPEYLGSVDFWSFFFLGFTFGALVMSWNLTLYLTTAHRFPFLASLARPFIKFCLNNFIIPLFAAGYLLAAHIRFEWIYESHDAYEIFLHCLGFIFGGGVLVILLFSYFHFTNKDILSFLKIKPNENKLQPPKHVVDVEGIDVHGRSGWRIDSYLTETLRFRPVRSVAHYETTLLLKVFKQNHFNALLVQLFSLIALITLGYLIDYPYFRIPAGASIFLLSSVLVAITGAIAYWFPRWRITVFIGLIILTNLITSYGWLRHENQAYGLDYQAPAAPYTYESLESICAPDTMLLDRDNTIRILNRWKQKVSTPYGEKPKLVVLATSGGGLKAALWTTHLLQQADLATGEQFSRHTTLITGASGGLIGAAYYRELFLRKLQGDSIQLLDTVHLDRVAKDMLNAISFAVVSNDIFMPWSKFEAGGYRYVKDRAYVFERQLEENLGYVFQKKIQDYWLPEQRAQVPMLFVTPSIVNDGRRLIISPQGVSYMMRPPIAVHHPTAVEIDAVDFGRLFREQNAPNLLFTSALRMNATFPYILPNVNLPSVPEIEVLDAGFRDDFGLKSASRYLHVFKDWITTNTSGVVLVQLRAFDRDREIKADDRGGVIESVFNPLGIAGKVISLQNYENDNSLGFLFDLLGPDHLEVIRFTYKPSMLADEATISFHLTASERKDILEAIHLPENQMGLQRLQTLLGSPESKKEQQKLTEHHEKD
jgi:hypothetical protein